MGKTFRRDSEFAKNKFFDKKIKKLKSPIKKANKFKNQLNDADVDE